jgi:hypothetical protein
MAYMFKQKLRIEDLVNIERQPKRIVLYEPEQYLAALYKHYLTAHNFDVKHCPELSLIKQLMSSFAPQVLVYNIEDSLKNAEPQLNRLIKLKKDFPETFVVTLGFNTSSEMLKLLLQAGVTSHINRKLSRPNDLVYIINALV